MDETQVQSDDGFPLLLFIYDMHINEMMNIHYNAPVNVGGATPEHRRLQDSPRDFNRKKK